MKQISPTPSSGPTLFTSTTTARIGFFVSRAVCVVALAGAAFWMLYYEWTYVDRTINAAAMAGDPAIALSILDVAIRKCDADLCATGALHTARKVYYRQAIVSGNESAIAALYLREGNEYFDLKREYLRNTLLMAKASNDKYVLAAAAQIYGDGRLEVIDTAAQMAYLERAWAAGDDSAAAVLADLYLRQMDVESAYFWSLRCFGACHRSNDTALDELARKLDADSLAVLQAKAREYARPRGGASR